MSQIYMRSFKRSVCFLSPLKNTFKKHTKLRKMYFTWSLQVVLQLFNETHLWAETNHRRFQLKK